MSELIQMLVFRLDEQRYAIALETVRRIIHAVEITPLPKAPDIVLGVIDIAGEVLPVLDVRRRFRLPTRKIQTADQFVLAQAAERNVVLSVDEALDVVSRSRAEIVAATQLPPGIDFVQGVVRLDDGLVIIHDLKTFLSLDEARALDRAMNAEAGHNA